MADELADPVDIGHVSTFLGVEVVFDYDDFLGIYEIQQAISDPKDGQTANLGEAEAIFGLLNHFELEGGQLLSDDRAACDFANRNGISTLTSVDILGRGYGKGYVDCPRAYEILVDMRAAGRGVRVPEDHYSVCPPIQAA